MAEFISERSVTVIFSIFNIFAVIFVMYRGREYVKKIYNRKVYDSNITDIVSKGVLWDK